jgi:ABC-type phosphate/phosphonate transport system substrate-binding protein
VIANARMYSVSPEAAALWRQLLAGIIATTDLTVRVMDYPSPLPLEELWARNDQAAVFMCGLPYSRALPRPALLAAPVPSPEEFGDQPRYWSDFVVRGDSQYHTLADTFGGRIALTVPGSQSGCVAALTLLMAMATAADADTRQPPPWFGEIVAPTMTPLGALNAVVGGAADVAPLDAYALRLLQKFRSDLTDRVRIVGHTVPTPIPPLVASRPDLAALREAFLGAHRVAALRPLMDQLLLHRFTGPAPDSYDVLESGFDAAQTYWRSHRLAEVVHPAFAPIFR